VRAFQHNILERYFGLLALNRSLRRAQAHFAKRTKRRVLRALRSLVEDIRSNEGGTKMYRRLRADAEAKQRAARLWRIEEKAVQDAAQRQYEESLRDFETEAELARHVDEESMRLDAREKLLAKQRAQAKLLGHRLLRHQREEVQWRREVERKWEEKEKEMVTMARRHMARFLETDDGRVAIEREAERLMLLRTPELVAQPSSRWEVWLVRQKVDAEPQRVLGPILPGAPIGLVPSVEEAGRQGLTFMAIDARTQQRTEICPFHRLDAATAVAAAHLEARELERARTQVRERRDAEIHEHYGVKAARALVGAFRARRFRRVLLDHVRSLTEQLVDHYTGDVFYVDRRTGRRSRDKPLVFRAGEEVRPLPRWTLRQNAGTGQWYYHNGMAPWKSSPNPPPHVLLCGVCCMDIADRRCTGAGCDGLPYCYTCWESQHPVAMEEWRAHEACMQRILVQEARCQLGCDPPRPASFFLWDGPTFHYPAVCPECHAERSARPGDEGDAYRAVYCESLLGRTSDAVAAAAQAARESAVASEAALAADPDAWRPDVHW
jgi:hypothetical protein